MLFLLQIIPTTLRTELPQNFDWWLRSVGLLFWHVQIVNKDYAFHA